MTNKEVLEKYVKNKDCLNFFKKYFYYRKDGKLTKFIQNDIIGLDCYRGYPLKDVYYGILYHSGGAFKKHRNILTCVYILKAYHSGDYIYEWKHIEDWVEELGEGKLKDFLTKWTMQLRYIDFYNEMGAPDIRSAIGLIVNLGKEYHNKKIPSDIQHLINFYFINNRFPNDFDEF